MNEETQNRSGLEIAVIGMDCRLPGAPDLDSFWANLRDGVESIRRFTHEELEAFGRHPEEIRADGFVPAHGVLDEMDKFDAEFFGFSPREAEVMDPQHRLFLETVWKGIENAGYTPSTFEGLIGLYAGCSGNTYLNANIMQNRAIREVVPPFQSIYSNYADFLCTRVSYKLGLRGPSLSILTACSTSLVAIHMACQQLLSGACDMAVAGGVSVSLPQHWGYLYQEGMILSPDGHCRTFDSKACGTISGDGVGVVVLKRLEDAIEDGDSIDAVILGSAINNDGDAKVGYSAPGINGQTDVIRSAQTIAEVSPDSITYVEAHGTGTPMGDPIEVSALTQAFREGTNRKQFCGLSSAKSNFGHLDAAAGVAGFIKAVLALKNQTLPPSLHFKIPNPEIDFPNSPFYVIDRCREWQSQDTPRRAGVSSFGIGGTNAHLILEEAPSSSAKQETDQSQYSLIPLSARSTTALEEMTGALKRHLQNHPEQDLRDIAFTLQHGRKGFNHRRVMVARNCEELISNMDTPSDSGTTGEVLGNPTNVVFLFTGQGSQYLNMARGLYEGDTEFRKDIDQCAEILLPHLNNEDIRQYLRTSPNENEEALSTRLTCTDMAQPAIFTVEYALARYWMRIGIKPSALIGHSLGELTAACIAGVFSLEDALRLVALRGRLMQSMPSGTMLAVPLTPEVVSPYLGNTLSLAAINTPSVCVVSGPKKDVEQLQKKILSEHDLDCRELHTSHAFHSHMMDPTVQPFREAVSACTTHPAQFPIISTITGKPLGPKETQDTEYWARNIRETVRFAEAVGQVIQRDNTVLLEVGPGKTLITLAKNHPDKTQNLRYVTSLRHPHQEIDDTAHLLASVGQLWIAGLPVDWNQVKSSEQRQRVHLPSYPFERKKFWIEPDPVQPISQPSVQQIGTALAVKPPSKDVADWFYAPTWKRSTLPSLAHSQEESRKVQRWLIFMDESGVADQFIDQLHKTQPNSDVTCVRFGAEFNQPGENAFTIRPDEPDDIENVIDHLVEADRTPDQILHFALLLDEEMEPSGSISPGKSELIQSKGFFSLLYLSRALFQYNNGYPMSLSVVSDKCFGVLGDETICPDKITSQAIAMVLPAELESMNARMIDVVRNTADGKLSQRDLTGIFNEVLSNKKDTAVAYRHGARWLHDIENVRLEKIDHVPSQLRDKGVYLITGGLGGMGLTLAGYLAETLQARLVLVGRQGLPPRTEWESWVAAQGESDPQSKKIRAVQNLERLGAQVQVHAAEVADETAMAKVVAEATQSFGAINGVIHAAGIPGGGIIAMQDKEKVEQVWSAKVGGTKVLLSLFRDNSPDFILLCSSFITAMGMPGRVEYTAANLFLDAVAQQQSTNQGLPVISINWDTWGEVGMALAYEEELSKEVAQISSSEGIEVFKRVIDQNLPQILNYSGAWPIGSSIDAANTSTQPTVEHKEEQPLVAKVEIVPATQSTAHDSGAHDDDPQTDVQAKLCRVWQETLGVARLGIHDNFFELGGDSVVSIQVIARSKQVGIRLTPKQIFQNQTVAELAKVAGQTDAVSFVNNEEVKGKAPLTPIQTWFFDQNFNAMHHWNMAQWIELPQDLDEVSLKKAVDAVIQQHDLLRARFNSTPSGWEQEIVLTENLGPVLSTKDISQVSPDNVMDELSAEAVKCQSSMDLSTGPLTRFVLFRTPEGEKPRLLMVIHHLIVDIIGLRIILEDLGTAYKQASLNQSIQLPAKSSSFKSWAEALQTYANSPELQNQLAYWLEKNSRQVIPLPRDFSAGSNSVGSTQLMARSFSAEETQAILNRINREKSMEMNDVLLAALSSALTEWAGGDSVRVELEGHGRNPINETIDVSRTVGWFTSVYPVVFQRPQKGDARSWLAHTSETLRDLPNKGFDYGVLRYSHPDLNVRQSLNKTRDAEVIFLYQGHLGKSKKENVEWSPSPESPPAMREQGQHRPHLFEFNIFIASDQLVVNLGYSDTIHTSETISKVLDKFTQHIVDFSASLDETEADIESDLDLSLVDLDESGWKQLEKLINN